MRGRERYLLRYGRRRGYRYGRCVRVCRALQGPAPIARGGGGLCVTGHSVGAHPTVGRLSRRGGALTRPRPSDSGPRKAE
jgi:hypothetical protein